MRQSSAKRRTKDECTDHGRLTIANFRGSDDRNSLIRGIIEGLSRTPKRISSVFFYDRKGAKLFEAITRLPEYYLTRTELALLPKMAERIAALWTGGSIIELGSGDSSKIEVLLGGLSAKQHAETTYFPVDISASTVEASAKTLVKKFPELTIHGVIGNFLTHWSAVPYRHPLLFCFFGSTIGNLLRAEGVQFVADISSKMGPDDLFLLSLDRVKPEPLLHAAYNDSAGVTAAFNKNCLAVINRIIKSRLDPADFRHIALYNGEQERIEMHLEAKRDIALESPFLEAPITIRKGERIHTENSHKFTDSHIKEFAQRSGFRIEAELRDPKDWFSVILFSKNVPATSSAQALPSTQKGTL